MAIIVKKFGGTSIGTIERIEKLAAKLVKERQQGDQLVVVVSAMAKTTDELFSLAHKISSNPFQRELDMLVTAGERISMSLLSIALHKYGASAISFTGSQSGIITDNCHGNASIINVSAFRIREELEKNKIVIVAGYQGVSLNKEITTLGRGGSDTTAVALAGYLDAQNCEIYTDVEGVFTADPYNISNVRKINSIDYDQMLYLARAGCKVIHPRAVEFAMKYNIELEIKSSFNDLPGTLVKKDLEMEEKKILAITGRNHLTCYDIALTKEETGKVLSALKMNNPEILEYAIPETELFRIIIEEKNEEVLSKKLAAEDIRNYNKLGNLSSITFTGLRMINDMGILEKVIQTLQEKNIEIFSLTRNHLGFTLYIKTPENHDLIEYFHNSFIVEGNVK
ncbi:MAG: aspartate kinase [Candidatus Cloacimonetes bacterium]|nr:aspartate kinase [Candidatus Cloacimonadota bacterium]